MYETCYIILKGA